MRVLVTGGAGYVGTRLSNALVRGGHRVRVLDALLYGSQGLRAEIDLRRGDLRQRSDAGRALEGVDVVFHLAALSQRTPAEGSVETPPRARDVEATHRLLREAQRKGVRRFVYGAAVDGHGLFEEEILRVVLDANRDEFETVALRKASVCGPSPRQRFDLGANAMAGSAWFDGRIVVPADDQPIAHLTMSDAVDLYLALLEARSEEIAGQQFEAGYEAMTSRELAELIRERVPTPNGVPAAIEVEAADAPEPLRGRSYDPSCIERALGFRPRATVCEMIDQLVQLMELGFLDRYDRDIYQSEPLRPAPEAAGRAWRLLQQAARVFPAGA